MTSRNRHKLNISLNTTFNCDLNVIGRFGRKYGDGINLFVYLIELKIVQLIVRLIKMWAKKFPQWNRTIFDAFLILPESVVLEI